MVGHGFRHMASTLLNKLGFNQDETERHLTHYVRLGHSRVRLDSPRQQLGIAVHMISSGRATLLRYSCGRKPVTERNARVK